MVDQSVAIENRLHAGEPQPQPDVDIFPTVLRERFVETAHGAQRRQRHRNIGRPEVIAAIIAQRPDRRRKIVEILDGNRGSAHDRFWIPRMRAQMLFDKIRQRQHVVVDQNDPLARR